MFSSLMSTSSSATEEVDSGVLKGLSNRQGACMGNDSASGERGDAMIEGSNEKGRSGGATDPAVISFAEGRS